MDRHALFDYAKKRFKTEPDYPWPSHPNHAVLRHAATRKWYALIMDVPAHKLGLPDDRHMDILNIKCDAILLAALLEQDGFFPAYHMNKNHWISVALNDDVPDDEIRYLLDTSFGLTR